VNEKVEISVVMSVYNGEKYLKESIESILNQTYENFEFLIIDDGSTDNSKEILKSYESQDRRIKLFFREENRGLTKNLNFLINNSRGKYIARMDADDVSFKDRFEKQINFFSHNLEIDILGTFAIDIDEYGNIIRTRTVPINDKEIKKMILKLSPLIHPTVMFKKNALEKISFYNEKFLTSQDLDMWYRAMAIGLKFHNIDEPLLYYRYDSNYNKKRHLKYRVNDFKVRFNGYKINKVPIIYWYNLFIPLVLGILPNKVYNLLKKFDPR
jgi:glycosyltransferase involved in cell wall biosynthesis